MWKGHDELKLSVGRKHQAKRTTYSLSMMWKRFSSIYIRILYAWSNILTLLSLLLLYIKNLYRLSTSTTTQTDEHKRPNETKYICIYNKKHTIYIYIYGRRLEWEKKRNPWWQASRQRGDNNAGTDKIFQMVKHGGGTATGCCRQQTASVASWCEAFILLCCCCLLFLGIRLCRLSFDRCCTPIIAIHSTHSNSHVRFFGTLHTHTVRRLVDICMYIFYLCSVVHTSYILCWIDLYSYWNYIDFKMYAN